MSANQENPGKQEQRGRRRAATARLVYVNEFDKGYRRRKHGRGFLYLSTRGKPLRSKQTLQRIKQLAIPPAWTEVWICPKTNGHIQARGRDQAGRRQYIYHPRWAAVSAAAKFDRLAVLAAVLPRIRRRVRRDLRGDKLTKKRVTAAAIRLIDKAGIRVGNEVYTRTHGTRGVTTLGPEHVEIEDMTVSLEFPGKSGKRRDIDLRDQKLASIIDRCEDIGGQFLFCYRDDDDGYQPLDSGDVNDYLLEVAREPITAKDFRTWAGSVHALKLLSAESPVVTERGRRKRVIAAVKATAELLGNTPAVCRNSYIHPALLAAAESGELDQLLHAARAHCKQVAELTVDECRFAALLPHLA
ncbi:MAG: DNA topoisomerase IB [Gammaproteobacteria bacterium]|nr:DNA topoisomerase IB [Gammaproteobacteria bacterium]